MTASEQETPQIPPTSVQGAAAIPPLRTRLLVSALLTVVALFVIFSPWPLEAKLYAIGHACCAQIPSHTITFSGARPMPIDSRNSGIYLGVFMVIAILWLTGRQRAALYAPKRVRNLLMGFTLLMMLDGFNSVAQSNHLHTFYTDSNTLRAITGTLAGMSLTILVVPVFNRLVWREPEAVAIADDYFDLLGYLGGSVIVIISLLQAPSLLYYPLSLASMAGLLITLTMVNTCIILVSSRRENSVENERGLFVPALGGLVFTCCEILLINLVRASGH